MNEMIERGAKAILAADKDGASYYDLMRAVVVAMQEPTQAMVLAGSAHTNCCDAWRAMIEAALTETTKEKQT